MESIADESRPYSASRLVATTAMIVGAGWMAVFTLGMMWGLVLEPLFNKTLSFESLFVQVASGAPVMFVVSIPGVCCLYNGNRLRKNVSVKSVRLTIGSICGTSVWILAGVLLSVVSPVVLGVFGMGMTGLLAAFAIMLPFYAIACRQVLIHDGIPHCGYRDVITEPVLLLITVLIWWMSMTFGIRVVFNKLVADASGFALFVTALVVPVVFSMSLYVMAKRLLHRNSPDDLDESSSSAT